MHTFVFVLAALLAVSTSKPIDSVVDVTEDTLGNYRFSFDSGDYSKFEERAEDGFTKGKYTFVDPDGRKHIIEYVAGAEHGVEAEGADIPVSVAEPVEIAEAREQHSAVFRAIESDPRFAESPADENEDPISSDEYLAALKEQVNPSVPLVFQADTPEIAAAKYDLLAAHKTAVGH